MRNTSTKLALGALELTTLTLCALIVPAVPASAQVYPERVRSLVLACTAFGSSPAFFA